VVLARGCGRQKNFKESGALSNGSVKKECDYKVHNREDL
jgi:hypothetical protein